LSADAAGLSAGRLRLNRTLCSLTAHARHAITPCSGGGNPINSGVSAASLIGSANMNDPPLVVLDLRGVNRMSVAALLMWPLTIWLPRLADRDGEPRGGMASYEVSDELWQRIQPLLPERPRRHR
jgi:hypothetical protein